MLLTEVYKPAISLQLVQDNLSLIVKDKTIPQTIVFYIPESEPKVKIQTALALLEIFPIKFNYLNRIHHTRAMKVKYGSSNAIYKVVLSSLISPDSYMCWFEHLPQGWLNLLGNDMDNGLKDVITAAIEYQEELG